MRRVKVAFLKINLSIVCNYKRVWNIHFGRLTINKVNTNFKSKREYCTSDVVDTGAYLKRFLCLNCSSHL